MSRRVVFILGWTAALLASPLMLWLWDGTGLAAFVRHWHTTESIAIVGGLIATFCRPAASQIRNETAQLISAMARQNLGERNGLTDGGDPTLAPIEKAIADLTTQTQQAVSSAAQQAKELELQLRVVTAERRHAQAIIYSISDAVLVTDSFDELVLANEAAARIFAFDLPGSQRVPVQQVVHDSRLVDMIREMRRGNSRTERRIIEHDVQTSTGARRFKIALSSVPDDRAGQLVGVVAVLQDMTREKELGEIKNEFVSNVSHELRTPLASIKAYIEMLIDGEAEDEKTTLEFYEVIQNEANRLSRLIDDILNISRIESGLLKVNKQPQSLTVIIHEAIEVITPQARQKNVTIHPQLTPVFFQTLADKDMLHQAILNLLSNAVKYTPENGSIAVETHVDEARKTVVTRVIDTGVGIPEADLPFVFDKFYRAEANNRMAKGTGLGLSLVKQIIETVHGGRIVLESVVGKGTSFGFELKLAE